MKISYPAKLKVYYNRLAIEGLFPSGWYWKLTQDMDNGYTTRGGGGAYGSRRKATIEGMRNKNRWESYAC